MFTITKPNSAISHINLLQTRGFWPLLQFSNTLLFENFTQHINWTLNSILSGIPQNIKQCSHSVNRCGCVKQGKLP